MHYWDKSKGMWRQTLDRYLLPFETPENIFFYRTRGIWCQHVWVVCTHEGLHSRGNVEHCPKISPYKRMTHFICNRTEKDVHGKDVHVCTEDKFQEGWDRAYQMILNERRHMHENRDIWLAGEETLEDILYSSSDHKHAWAMCSHSGFGAYGDNTICKIKSEYSGYTHEMCIFCGINRYMNGWTSEVRQILDNRKKKNS